MGTEDVILLSQNQQGGCNVIATSSVVVDVTLLLQIKSVISTPPPLSRHHTHIFPAHILPASLVSASHSLNTSTFAPPEYSFSSGFLSRRLSTHPEPPEL